MKKLPILLLAVLLTAGCKKKEESNPVPDYKELTDFLYLPVRDAEWRVHMQGYEITDLGNPCQEEAENNFDTAWHQYTTIRSTGSDTFIRGRKYYRYHIWTDHEYTRVNCKSYEKSKVRGSIFLREDTIGKRIIAWLGGNDTAVFEDTVADFSKDQPGDRAIISEYWPASEVAGFNNAIINGQKSKMWEGVFRHDKMDKFFLKGYGIGGQIGILPSYYLWYSQPRAVELIYKGESTRFDFPLQYYIK